MGQILLEVDDQAEKAWRKASPELRMTIEKRIEQLLVNYLNDSNKVNFDILLQDARNEAASSGLT